MLLTVSNKLKFVVKQTYQIVASFATFYVPQCSVATRLRCDGIWVIFIKCLLLSSLVKEFRKSTSAVMLTF